ncbi:MAG: sulfoxide reductase heme-binding subunit YedZ [Acidobacteria bacterium]|nr:sulfoxide reductase heme-binding subunit YedZ [Acidobacteriota bacterium]
MKRHGIVSVKVLVWAACLAPLLRLVEKGLTGGLGANPIEFVTLSTGTWTLVLLLASLAVTPLRHLTGLPWLVRLRRPIGIFAFFYGSLHLITYVWLDKFFDPGEIVNDVLRRPFITAGFLAYLLLVPLAATSTAGAIRRMGGKRWQKLHRLVYVSAVAGVLHFWWKVKADIREPMLYASVLAVLLGYRLAASVRRWLAAAKSGR